MLDDVVGRDIDLVFGRVVHADLNQVFVGQVGLADQTGQFTVRLIEDDLDSFAQLRPGEIGEPLQRRLLADFHGFQRRQLRLKLANVFHGKRRRRHQTHRIGFSDFIFRAQAVYVGLDFVHERLLFVPPFFQSRNAVRHHFVALSQTIGSVSLRDGVGEISGFFRLITLVTDLNDAGITPPQRKTHVAFDTLDGLGGLEGDAAVVQLAPLFIELQILDDLAQDDFRLQHFKFSLNEVRVVTLRCVAPSREGADVGNIVFDPDTGRTGIGFRHDESHDRRGDHDEEKDREDDRLADADNAPVIKEVQLGLRLRNSFG